MILVCSMLFFCEDLVIGEVVMVVFCMEGIEVREYI